MNRSIYFLKINIRSLFLFRKLTLISLIGLSVSLIANFLIFSYIRFETSFDDFNPNAENIYRLITKKTDDESYSASTPFALSEVLKSDYPEIDKVIGLIRAGKDIEAKNNVFKENKGAIVEKEFFSHFNIPLKSGDQKSIFNTPYEAVLSEAFALKIFDNPNPVGKTFTYGDDVFEVVGLVDPIPNNSLFDFDYFLSDKYKYKAYPHISDLWYQFGMFTYVTFKNNIVPQDFEEKLTNIEIKYYPDFMKNRHEYNVIPFKGSHLNDALYNDITPPVDPVYLWILSVIAISILIIACLNFMNISLTNTKKQSIYTGIKKVNGASNNSLITDFFLEISSIVLISFILSFIFTILILPEFNKLIDEKITINFKDPVFWSGIAAFGIITAVLSGLYPSIIVSRYSFRGFMNKRIMGEKIISLQKGFIILQLVIAITLVVTQLLFFKQISFMQNHDLGFEKENLIAFNVRPLGNNGAKRLKKTEIFVQSIEKHQAQFGFEGASISEFIPGFSFRNQFKVFSQKDQQGIEVLSNDVDENFMNVYDLNLIKGRYFSKDHSTDNDALILNETAYRMLGMEQLEGQEIGLFTPDNKKKVIGVVNDINVKSLKHPVQPMIYQFGAHHGFPRYLTIRLNPQKEKESMAFLKQEWESLFPEVPFEPESVEDKFQSAYGDVEEQSLIIGLFSIIAVLLTLFGLFALSAFETEKRTKEIGIRKVNGAKASEILIMLNKYFVTLVFIAFIIASPVSYGILRRWLDHFAYKTALSWWVFILSGLFCLAIVLITVSLQSWKAASRNPVDTLKYD